jgi:hypothetical protein
MSDSIKTLNGIYKATVTDNKDPKKQNRLKVSLQFFNTPIGSTKKPLSTDWISPVTPSGLDLPGPSIGQGVWVMFQAGDPSFPVWIGEFGKHQEQSKKVLIKPLQNSVSLTGLTPYLIISNQSDGTQEVDLVATLLAMAAKLKDHETRIHTLETTPDIDPS